MGSIAARDDDGVVAFGQKLLALLETGSFTTSYKFATLLGILDEVLENVGPDGAPPRWIHGAAVADRVLTSYWAQARPYGAAGPLAQSRQRDLAVKALELRAALSLDEWATLDDAAVVSPEEVASLRREVHAVVLRYPIPLLQRLGDGRGASEDRFIYDYGWDSTLTAAGSGAADFDDRLHFVERAAEFLLALEGLLRPLVQEAWTTHVAKRNTDRVEDSRLRAHLFGTSRIDLTRVRRPLLDLQQGHCFYCGRNAGPWEVDHFLPWARWADDCIENLVVADRRCNNAKRAALAGAGPLAAWWERGQARRAELGVIAFDRTWPSRPDAAVGVARALYLRQPEGAALWTPAGIERAQPDVLASLLTVGTRDGGHHDLAAEEVPPFDV